MCTLNILLKMKGNQIGILKYYNTLARKYLFSHENIVVFMGINTEY